VTDRQSAVTLDVVIPTRDRESQLRVTLSALAQQDSKEFGVVVVDDGGVADAARSVPQRLRDALAIRFVRNEVSIGPGPSRNRGVASSEATYIVFMDDDCIAVPGFIARHIAVLSQSGEPVVSLGPILPPPGQRLSVWNHWDADRVGRVYARWRDGVSAPTCTHLYTGNVGVRRADFLAVGGFDARFLRQEDVELGYRLGRYGCRFEFSSDATVFHDSTRSLDAWMRIPAATAQFDVLMDRLDPDSGRLSSVVVDLDSRHWALRLARRIVRTSGSRRKAARGAVAVGRLLHGLHADRAGMAACSLAWDLTYCAALGEARSSSTRTGA
jgi:GT2 family glycosyltransferase